VLSLRQQKPLVVAIAGAATSGGYHMAVAGNRIYAPAVAEVGNIGAISSRPWDPALSPDVLSTGPYKLSGGSRFDNIRQLELVRDSFLGNVVYQRSQSPYNPLKADAKTVAEARVYLGSEALALGLVDAPGALSDGISAAAELAGITSYRVVQLTDYLGLTFQPTAYFKANSLFKAALPGTVFMLDSRIPLSAPLAENAATPGARPAWSGPLPSKPGDLLSIGRAGGDR
jgi:protease-4